MRIAAVVREEAEQQASEQRLHDNRSKTTGRQGEPLNTEAEELYQVKLDNMEWETILKRPLNPRGESVRHKTKRNDVEKSFGDFKINILRLCKVCVCVIVVKFD